MATDSLIFPSYRTLEIEKMNEVERDKLISKLFKHNKSLNDLHALYPLDYFISLTLNIDEVMFLYMPQKTKEALLSDLRLTYILLLAQKKHEHIQQKRENQKFYDSVIEKCQHLIDNLLYSTGNEEVNSQSIPGTGYAAKDSPVKYLFIDLGRWFGEKINDIASRKTKTIKDILAAINDRRLYWIWSNSLLTTVLGLLSTDFFNAQQAGQIIAAPAPYLGILSWALYYFQGSLNLCLLLKHTIKGPWMSKEESEKPWRERFLTQWEQRKFTLLNDFVWATGNCLCFFVLNGSGALGTIGDVLTIALLTFDICLAFWEFEERKTQFYKKMTDFDQEINRLNHLIDELKTQTQASDTAKQELNNLYIQINSLRKVKAQCQKDWDYQNIKLKINIAYAVGLMSAFIVLATPFLPISGAVLVALTVTGAVLCFAATIIYSAAKKGVDTYKAYDAHRQAKQDYAIKMAEFEVLLQNPDLDDNEKKFLFLEIKQIIQETTYQKQMIIYEAMNLTRSIILQTLIPVVLFVTLVFLPLGIGITCIGAALVLAVCTQLFINKVFQPQKEALKSFDEEEYLLFCNNPKHWHQQAPQKKLTFFKKEEPHRFERRSDTDSKSSDTAFDNPSSFCQGK